MMIKPLAALVKITGWLPYLAVARPRIHYEDKEAQARRVKGKAIVMPDHHSIWDAVTMMYTFPGRDLRCIISEVICQNNPIGKWFMRSMGYIYVDRSNMDFTFLSESGKILGKGGVVEIYPEARLPRPGEEKPLAFKPSVVYMALENDAPIIPVVTNGAFFGKKRMQVLIGKPVRIEEYYDETLDERENIEHITALLRNRIIELKNELEAREDPARKEGISKEKATKRLSV